MALLGISFPEAFTVLDGFSIIVLASSGSQQESLESRVLGVVTGSSVSSERRSLFPPDRSAMVGFLGVVMLHRFVQECY